MTAINAHGRILAILIAWTLTSFLCHYMAKTFLHQMKEIYGGSLETTLLSVSILTVSQILFCVTLIDRPGPETSTDPWITVYILGLHALATLMTNGSMSVLFAASTFAVKLLEPITGAIAQKLLLGTKLSSVALFSLPVIVTGAMMFTGNPLQEVTMSIGTTLACISNVSLALRNVAIKRQHISKTAIRWRKWGTIILIIYLAVVAVYLVIQYAFTYSMQSKEPSFLLSLGLLVGSSLFHVVYSYISTAVVLKEMSVVSHAVGNIFKRLFVIVLLYVGGKRTATVDNFFGLTVCTLGLVLYTWDKLRTNKAASVKQETDEGTGVSFSIKYT